VSASAEPRRAFFIDALNLAYWCGNPPTLRIPLTLMAGLLDRGHQALLYFDASAVHRLPQEAALYMRLRQHPHDFIEVPARRTADGVMLRQARASGACIVSRDRYRDYRRRYRKLIDDPARLLPGAVADERVLVPSLALDLPLIASADEAWQRVEAALASAPLVCIGPAR